MGRRAQTASPTRAAAGLRGRCSRRRRFRHESPYIRVKQAFDDFGAECFAPGRPVLACAEALMQKIHRELKYAPGETSIATPLAEVLGESARASARTSRISMIACAAFARARRALCQRLHPAAACDPVGGLRRGDPARWPFSRRARPQPQLDWVGAGASHAWVSGLQPAVRLARARSRPTTCMSARITSPDRVGARLRRRARRRSGCDSRRRVASAFGFRVGEPESTRVGEAG